MNFFFRVDASLNIGIGHLVRCLTLAKELKKRGKKCTFLCKDYNRDLIKKIYEENFKVIILSSIKKKNKKLENNNIDSNLIKLNKNLNEDAKLTIKAIEKKQVDWLIVDHYGIDIKWEKKVRKYVKNILIIDDLANRKHDCDLLLDQNLIANYKKRYNHLLPSRSSILLGPKYSLLQNIYKNLHFKAKPRSGFPKKILIYFGGTNQTHLIDATLSALSSLDIDYLKINVVINFNRENNQIINKFKNKFENIKFYNERKSLAPLILKADLAIGACGTTTWERCCLGLPSLVITISKNQIPIAKELNKQNLIYWIGHYNKISEKKIIKAIKKYLHKDLKNFSETCKSVTNGRGAEKVASILTLSPKTKLIPHFAKYEDEGLLLEWANDPLVRKNSFNKKVISLNEHKNWFQNCLNNSNNCKILIINTKEMLPVGQVRIEKKNKRWFIDFSLVKFARNKKIGHKLIGVALKKYKKEGISQFFGEVKTANIASCRTFEKSGFKKKVNTKDKYVTYFYRNSLLYK